jgi:hypothetical protein
MFFWEQHGFLFIASHAHAVVKKISGRKRDLFWAAILFRKIVRSHLIFGGRALWAVLHVLVYLC